MNACQKTTRRAILAAILLVSLATMVTFSVAQNPPSKSPVTVSQLAGPWQIAVVGNTGCGVTSLQFNGTLNSTGTAVGTLIGSSGCGTSNNSETFTIESLNANGSGTAGLSCGSGCGWTFQIQVGINRQIFNLVDVTDPGNNVLAGTAIRQ